MAWWKIYFFAAMGLTLAGCPMTQQELAILMKSMATLVQAGASGSEPGSYPMQSESSTFSPGTAEDPTSRANQLYAQARALENQAGRIPIPLCTGDRYARDGRLVGIDPCRDPAYARQREQNILERQRLQEEARQLRQEADALMRGAGAGP